ncbi:MAG: tyrosine-protein phosphatase [Coriobacteriales bacterium]|nr:tyrosine-protein phosphatase [Coriobacteriales bacterium]
MVEIPLRSCTNVRDLGEYDTPRGTTRTHRFLRCGGTRILSRDDLEYFRAYGVTRVLDLRSVGESPKLTCRLSNQPWVTWRNIPLYEYDISAPTIIPTAGMDNYLVSSYLHMLTAQQVMRDIFGFFATASPSECVLFHCAAGMDRTGMLAMLLLGLANVPREQILADYCYSFAPREDVDAAIATGVAESASEFASFILQTRLDAIGTVYDTIVQTHGSVRDYLRSCGIEPRTLDTVRAHLCD